MVRSCPTATGLVTSSTVTVAGTLVVFPFTSVTLKVTVLLPISLQSKDVISKLLEAIPQLSEIAFSMSEVVIVSKPLASSSILIFCVVTVGQILS